MKRSFAGERLVVALAVILTLGMSKPAHAWTPRCSLASVAGNWSFTDNGTVIGVGPRTAVGIFTLDGSGNLVKGVATSSLNGSVAQETFYGTYTVNSDCSGTASVQIFVSGTEILALTMSIAFDDGSKEMRAIFSSLTLPDGTVLPTVISLEARKQCGFVCG